MSNRCPSCEKFVSLEIGEPEDNGLALDGDTLSGEVRLALTCAECSEEMKDTIFDVSETIDEITSHLEEHGPTDENPDPEIHEVTLDSVSLDSTDRYQDKDRHGKPIKSYRYMRHFMVRTSAELSCSCGEKFTYEFSVEEQASAFAELF